MKKIFNNTNNALNLKKVKEGVEGMDPSLDDEMDPSAEGEMDLGSEGETDLGDEGADDEMVADDEMGDDAVAVDDGAGDEPKDLLMKVIMAIIDGDEEAATDSLHQYMASKSSDIVNDDEPELDDASEGEPDLDDASEGEPDLDDASEMDLGGEGEGEMDLGSEGEGEVPPFKPEDEEVCMGCKHPQSQCSC